MALAAVADSETMISSTSPGQSSVRCRHMQLTAQRSAAARAGPRACMHVGLRTEPAGGWQCSIFSRQAMAAAAVALLLRIPAVVTASATLVFSPPAVVSAPVPCATAAGVGCGFVQNASCKCPTFPLAAGGVDGFYGLDATATRMMGVYDSHGLAGNRLTYTSDGGQTWRIKGFGSPDVFAWNLAPVHANNGSRMGRRSFGGISVGGFNDWHVGSKTDRSWSDKQSATFTFDAAGELQMAATGPVTIGPLPQPVNNTNAKGAPFSPQFYGGPIELRDGSLLGTIGLFWSKGDPLSPTWAGPQHRMSVVAIRSTDGAFNWHFAGVVANASGPGGYPNSTFGLSENDLALLADNKTLLCVIRMDGDAGCASKSYRNFGATYSRDSGATWSRAVPIAGAGCARPKLLKLAGGPLVLSGGRLCIENTDDISIWVNEDGMAGAATGGPGSWQKHSVSFWHNAMWAGPTIGKDPNSSFTYNLLFDAEVNNSNAFGTLGYTSLIPAGPREFVIIYQKFYSPHFWPPWPQATFQMRVSLSSNK